MARHLVLSSLTNAVSWISQNEKPYSLKNYTVCVNQPSKHLLQEKRRKVRQKRFELSWVAPLPPQSSASTNFATAAGILIEECKNMISFAMKFIFYDFLITLEKSFETVARMIPVVS